MVVSIPEAEKFQQAVDQQVYLSEDSYTIMQTTQSCFKFAQYWYELYLDDLPMWGMVGETLRDESTGKMAKVTKAS